MKPEVVGGLILFMAAALWTWPLDWPVYGQRLQCFRFSHFSHESLSRHLMLLDKGFQSLQWILDSDAATRPVHSA